MPLANPTSLTITRLHAVNGDAPFIHPQTGQLIKRPSYFFIYGTVSWVNTETNPHSVELTAQGQKTYLPKGSTTAYVQLGQTQTSSKPYFFHPTTGSASATVSVQLRGASGDSSVVSASTTVDMTAVPEFSGSLSFGTALIIPNWTGVPWNPIFSIYDETGNLIPRGSGYVGGSSLISGNEYGSFLPLIAGRTYKAVLSMGDRFKPVVQTITVPNPGGLGGSANAVYTFGHFTAYSTVSQELFFSPDPALTNFTTVSESLKILSGSKVQILLKASHPATWVINSGAPSGFVITARNGVAGTDYYLEGTAPATLTTYSVSLTATRISDSTTANAAISFAVVASENPTDRIQIITNPGWLNNGLSYNVGDTVSVALASNPSNDGAVRVIWSATGLPPGLSIDTKTGSITGRLTASGRFLASILVSPSAGNLLEPSLPATITFTVRDAVAPPGGGGSQPSNRIPWILAKWTLTDLQVLARTREVQSTLITATSSSASTPTKSGSANVQITDGNVTVSSTTSATANPSSASPSGLRLKVGDNINFAVFFVGADDRPFELAPSRLRVTIRPADNLEGSLVFESEDTPAAVTTEPDPYYLLATSTSGRQRQTVQEWVEDTGKNEPLACVADVDWIKDGQHFSSASFPVLLELDVTRP
jgi:VCBS repeat-containing protein